MAYLGSSPAFSVSDGPQVDAFSSLRVSQKSALFQAQCQYDSEPLQYEVGTTGTGVSPTHNTNTRMVTISCTAGTGTSFIQSYRYIPYQAGRSQIAEITGVMGSAVAGCVKEVGLFDL